MRHTAIDTVARSCVKHTDYGIVNNTSFSEYIGLDTAVFVSTACIGSVAEW